MAKPKVYKCGFRHCQHESCEVSQEEAVQVGRRYFHSDCAEIYYNMQEIQRLYREKISNYGCDAATSVCYKQHCFHKTYRIIISVIRIKICNQYKNFNSFSIFPSLSGRSVSGQGSLEERNSRRRLGRVSSKPHHRQSGRTFVCLLRQCRRKDSWRLIGIGGG